MSNKLRSYKFDMSQGQGSSPWRSTSVVNVGGGGLVDYVNSSDTDDDEISLRIKKEAEDVDASSVDEGEAGLFSHGHDDTFQCPYAALGIPDGVEESDAGSTSANVVGNHEKKSLEGIDAGDGHCFPSNPVSEESFLMDNDSKDNVNSGTNDAGDSILVKAESVVGNNAAEPDVVIESVVEIQDEFKDDSTSPEGSLDEDSINVDDSRHKPDQEDDGIPRNETIDSNDYVKDLDVEGKTPVDVVGYVLDAEVTDSSCDTGKSIEFPSKGSHNDIDHNDNLLKNPNKIPASPVDIEKIVQICETKYPVIYKPDKKSLWRKGCIVNTKDDDKVDIRDLDTEDVHIDIPKKYVKPGEKNLEILNSLDRSYTTAPSIEKKMKFTVTHHSNVRMKSRGKKNFGINREAEAVTGNFTKLRKRPTPAETSGHFSPSALKQSTNIEILKDDSSKTEESEDDVGIAEGKSSVDASEEIKPMGSIDPEVLDTSHQFSDAEDNDEEESNKNTADSTMITSDSSEKTLLPTIFEEGSTVESSLDGDGSVSCPNPAPMEQPKEDSLHPETNPSPGVGHSFSAESDVEVKDQPASILESLLQCFGVQNGKGNIKMEDDSGREFCRRILATNSSDISDNDVSILKEVFKKDKQLMQMIASGAMENFKALSTLKLGIKVNRQNIQFLYSFHSNLFF